MSGAAHRLGPHSRPSRLGKPDGRTREGKLAAAVRRDLIAHLGGKPSAVQKRLIDRIALLSVHVALFDERALSNGSLTERDSRAYLAFSNSLSRSLRLLGLNGASLAPPSLSDVVAEIAAEKAGAHA